MGEIIIFVLGLATAVVGLAEAVVELLTATRRSRPREKGGRKRK